MGANDTDAKKDSDRSAKGGGGMGNSNDTLVCGVPGSALPRGASEKLNDMHEVRESRELAVGETSEVEAVGAAGEGGGEIDTRGATAGESISSESLSVPAFNRRPGSWPRIRTRGWRTCL